MFSWKTIVIFRCLCYYIFCFTENQRDRLLRKQQKWIYIMKKTAKTALLLVMLISLISCTAADILGTTSSAGTSETQQNSTLTSGQVPDPVLPMRGSSEDGVYESGSLGIGIEFDSEWTLFNDTRLASLNGITEDAFKENYTEIIKTNDLVYDMYAMRSDGSTMNIYFENMDLMYGSAMSESDYIDASASQMETTFAQMNWIVESSEKLTVNAAEQEFSAFKLSVNIGTGYLYETVMCKKIGGHMAVTNIASVSIDVIDGIIADFYKL